MSLKKSLITGIMLLLSAPAFAQNKDAILGKWESEHGSGRIQIYKTGDKYFGKLIWLKSPNDSNGKPKVDIKNPSRQLQSQPIVGLEILKNFEYKGNNVWDKGTVYDPKSGNTYSCKMALAGSDKLAIRGYMGISFIGKTETWTRVPLK